MDYRDFIRKNKGMHFCKWCFGHGDMNGQAKITSKKSVGK